MFEQINDYGKEVRKLIKKQKESTFEDLDETLRLKGELRAINKIIKMFETK